MKEVAQRMRNSLSFWHVVGDLPGGALSEPCRTYVSRSDSLARLVLLLEELQGESETGREKAQQTVHRQFEGLAALARVVELEEVLDFYADFETYNPASTTRRIYQDEGQRARECLPAYHYGRDTQKASP